jgi:FeS assembly SUF system regulator
MLRLGRLTDYAIVLSATLADRNGACATARALSRETGISRPTVIKLLKILTGAGLARSIQGRHGGYALARTPADIGLTEIIEAVEGRIALTECNREAGACAIQESCLTHRHWLVINRALRQALTGVRLADLAGASPSFGGFGNPGAASTFFDGCPLTLLAYATARLRELPGLRILGEALRKAPLISFVLQGMHAHDLGTILDRRGLAVRAGHHCAMPLMDFYDLPATTRASLAFYNTREDVDRLVEAVGYARQVLA